MKDVKTYYVPVGYEMYGRIPVHTEEGTSRDELFNKAREILSNCSIKFLEENCSYLENSEETDEDGYIEDENGNVVED